MQPKKILLAGLASLIIALASNIAIGDQPHMNNALSSLQAARNQLVEASPNKGGHRERAIALIDQAIDEVNRGINYAD